MICGRCSIRLEFGDGSSARWMASAEASSIKRDRRVKTFRTTKVRIRSTTIRNIVTPRRMMKRRICVRRDEREEGKRRRRGEGRGEERGGGSREGDNGSLLVTP